MIPLSQAITKGSPSASEFGSSPYNDPLGAAYLGQLHPGAIDAFWALVRSSSHDSLCAHMLRGLHRAWPHLGSSVRAWPRLAEELERDRLIPRLRTNQPEYRQEIHVSLWKAIADMHAAGEPKGRIAEFLGRHGL